MSDDPNKQNGAPATQKFEVPEGDRFLFVRMGQDGAFQILFSDAQSALALHHIAARWLDLNLIDPSVAPRTQANLAMPAGLDMGSIARRMKKGFGNS